MAEDVLLVRRNKNLRQPRQRLSNDTMAAREEWLPPARSRTPARENPVYAFDPLVSKASSPASPRRLPLSMASARSYGKTHRDDTIYESGLPIFPPPPPRSPPKSMWTRFPPSMFEPASKQKRFEGLGPPARRQSDTGGPSPSRQSVKDPLKTLERYVQTEVFHLPRNTLQRLDAFREVFNNLIKLLPAHGALLSEIKREYDVAIDTSKINRSYGLPVSSPLPTSLPLEPQRIGSVPPPQHTKAYWERQWRVCQHELSIARSERRRLRALVQDLRVACGTTCWRLQGTTATEGGGASLAEQGIDDWVEPTVEDGHGAWVNDLLEREIDWEIKNLSTEASRTEQRVHAADQLTGSLGQTTSSARQLVERMVQVDARMDQDQEEHAATLRQLLDTLRDQEEQITRFRKLLGLAPSMDVHQ